LLHLPLYLLLQELLRLGVERVTLVELEVIKVAELLPKTNQQGLFDGIALVDETVNLKHPHATLLVILDHLRDFLEQLFELPAVNLFLQETIEDLIHQVVGDF
jgi:hypothetical protein